MDRIKGIVYGIVSSSTFGLIPLFALPAIRGGIGVDSVMFYRFGISALVLGLWLLFRKHDLKVSGKEVLTLAILGIFYAMTALLLTTSYLYADEKRQLPVLRFRPAISFHANAMHKLCARRYI